MKAPSRELLSFRRTFALVILLVVLPSAGLSGFGVLAIINERAAVEKRLAVTWGRRLEAVAEGLRVALAEAEVVPLQSALSVRAHGLAAGPMSGFGYRTCQRRRKSWR